MRYKLIGALALFVAGGILLGVGIAIGIKGLLIGGIVGLVVGGGFAVASAMPRASA